MNIITLRCQTMNTQLVDGLFQVIQSLSEEERAQLQEKMKKPDERETLERIQKLRAKIKARRDGKPFDPSVEEIIHQIREERDEQMNACFPELFKRKSASEG